MADQQTPTWDDFIADAAGSGASDADLGALKDIYFSTYVAPRFEEKDLGVIRQAFDSRATLPEKPGFFSELSKGTKRGLATKGMGLAGSAALAAQATGDRANIDRANQMVRQQGVDSQKYQSPYSNYENVRSLGDVGRFAGASIGEMFGNVAPTMGLAAASGPLAPVTAAADIVTTTAGNQYAQALQRADEQTALDQLYRGQPVDVRDSYQNIDKGKLALGTAGTSALEAAGYALGPAGRLIFRGKAGLGKTATDLLTKEGPLGSRAGNAALGAAKGALGEGTTEFAQEFTDEYGAGNPDWMSMDTARQGLQAGVSAAVGGGFLGGAGGAFQAPNTPAVRDTGQTFEDQLKSEGLMDEAPQAPQPSPAEISQAARDEALGRIDALEAVTPDLFDVVEDKKNRITFVPELSFSEFSKKVDANWKASVPQPSEAELDDAFAQAVEGGYNKDYKAFANEVKKQREVEYEQENPRLNSQELVALWRDYKELHGNDVRDFRSARDWVGSMYEAPNEGLTAPTVSTGNTQLDVKAPGATAITSTGIQSAGLPAGTTGGKLFTPPQPGAVNGQTELPLQEGQSQTGNAAQGPQVTPPVTAAPPVVPPAKVKPKNRRMVDPEEDDLVLAVRKLGGINVDLETDFAGRLKSIPGPTIVGIGNVERTKGKGRSLDDLAEALVGYGYLTSEDPKRELYEKLESATGGIQHWSTGKQGAASAPADNGTDLWIERLDQAGSEDDVVEIARSAGNDPRFQARFQSDPTFADAWRNAMDYALEQTAPVETRQADAAPAGTEAPTQDLMPTATGDDRVTADRLALEEAQREKQRKLNATDAPRGGGLFDQDNRQDDLFAAPTETPNADNPSQPVAGNDQEAPGEMRRPGSGELSPVGGVAGTEGRPADGGAGAVSGPQPGGEGGLSPAGNPDQSDAALTEDPRDRHFIGATKLKGVEDRGDGIYYVPEQLMTPARRRKLMDEAEKNKPYISTRVNPTARFEFKDWSAVTGNPTDKGYAILDRGLRQVEREGSANQSDAALTDGVVGSNIRYLKSSLLGKNAAPAGISRDDAQVAIDSIKSGIPEDTDLVFRIVDTLPEPVRGSIGEGGRAKGYLLPRAQDRDAPNVVVIDRSAHDSVRDAEDTLRHEVLGHYGLNLFSPADKRQILERVLASQKMPTMFRVFSAARRDYPDMGPNSLELAEEVFARVAQTRPSGVAKVLESIEGLIAKGLRKIGLIKKHPTRAELRKIVDAIADGVRRGVPQQTLPANAQAQFQRESRPQMAQPLLDATKDLFTDKAVDATLNLLLNPIQVAELNPQYPSAGAYADATQAMQVDMLRNQHRIAGLVDRMARLPKVSKDMLMDLMTKSTLLGVNPDIGPTESAKQMLDGREVEISNAHLATRTNGAKQHEAMRKAYQALPPAAKTLYSEIRNHFSDSWNRRIETIRALADESDVSPETRAKLNKEMDALSAKIVGPYFPLMREGRFAVIWKSQDLLDAEEKNDTAQVDKLKESASDYWVRFTDSKSEAETLSKKAPEGMKDNAQGYYNLRTSQSREAEGASSAFMSNLEEALAKKISDGTVRDDVMQSIRGVFLQTLPELSVMKRTLMRRGVAGVNADDMMQSIARAGIADAHYLARISHMSDIVSALSNLRKEDAKALRGKKPGVVGTPQGGIGRVYNSMMNSFKADMIRPESNGLNDAANKLMGFSYVHSLALDTGNLIANVLQPQMTSFPLMGAKYGFAKAEKAMVAALGDTVKMVGKNLRAKNLDVTRLPNTLGEHEAVASMLDLAELSQSRELAMIGRGQNRKWNAFLEALALPSHYVETVSRLSTMLAAYRLEVARINSDPNYSNRSQAERQGLAVRYASRLSGESLGNYTAGGVPNALRGNKQALTRLALQFKRYAITMLYLYGKAARDSVKGDREAQKTLAALLTLQFTIAGGLSGLPVALPAKMVAALFPGDDDDESEEQKLDRLANAMAGGDKTLGTWLRKGPLSAMTGIDVSRKMGLGDLMALNISLIGEAATGALAGARRGVTGNPQVAPRNPSEKWTPGKVLEDTLPALHVLYRVFFDGLPKVSEGKLADGVVAMLPKNAFSSMFNELVMEKTRKSGLTNPAGTVQKLEPEKYSDWDILLKSIDLPLMLESNVWEKNSAWNAIKQPKADRRADILERYVAAKKRGDKEKVSSIEQEIDRFNASLPEEARKSMKIKREHMLSRMNSAKKADKQMANSGGVRSSKKERPWAKSVTETYNQ